MPNRNVVANKDSVFLFHPMQHAAILNVGVVADADRINVPAQHRIHPNTGVLAQFDVADDLRGGVYIAGLGDFRCHAFVGANHAGSVQGAKDNENNTP